MASETVWPCRKCGPLYGVYVLHETLKAHSFGWWVECAKCKAKGPRRDTEEEAVAAWNKEQGNV